MSLVAELCYSDMMISSSIVGRFEMTEGFSGVFASKEFSDCFHPGESC